MVNGVALTKTVLYKADYILGHVSKYDELCFTHLRIRKEAKGLSLEFCHLFICVLFVSITSDFTAQNAMMDRELK